MCARIISLCFDMHVTLGIRDTESSQKSEFAIKVDQL